MEANKTQVNRELEATKAQRDALKKSLATLKDSLNTLNLNVKYMQFDLEATRRENLSLRKMIESHNDE